MNKAFSMLLGLALILGIALAVFSRSGRSVNMQLFAEYGGIEAPVDHSASSSFSSMPSLGEEESGTVVISRDSL